MNHEFDVDSIINELSDSIESALEDILTDRVEDAVVRSLHDALPEALSESLSAFEAVLPDGTLIRPRRHMKLLSPDQSKLLLCYGGLRVDGCTLMVQTRISCWETIAAYPSREEAVAALLKVKNAMDAGVSSYEL